MNRCARTLALQQLQSSQHPTSVTLRLQPGSVPPASSIAMASFGDIVTEMWNCGGPSACAGGLKCNYANLTITSDHLPIPAKFGLENGISEDGIQRRISPEESMPKKGTSEKVIP